MSLIAAAIASIAGSAVAAPGLNVPSLEQVNLEGDLDVYPRVAVQDNSNHDKIGLMHDPGTSRDIGVFRRKS